MKEPIALSRRTFLAASAALLAEACGGPSTRPPSAGAPFRIVDTMPAFFDFWERAEGAPLEEAGALFRELVVARYPEAYVPSVLGAGSEAELDARIDRFLPRLPALVPVMRRLHRAFEARLEEGTRRFRASAGTATATSWRRSTASTARVARSPAGPRSSSGST